MLDRRYFLEWMNARVAVGAGAPVPSPLTMDVSSILYGTPNSSSSQMIREERERGA